MILCKIFVSIKLLDVFQLMSLKLQERVKNFNIKNIKSKSYANTPRINHHKGRSNISNDRKWLVKWCGLVCTFSRTKSRRKRNI